VLAAATPTICNGHGEEVRAKCCLLLELLAGNTVSSAALIGTWCAERGSRSASALLMASIKLEGMVHAAGEICVVHGWS